MRATILYGPRDVRFEKREPPQFSRARQKLAREFGATCIVAERGDDAVARIREMTMGIGADAVLECVGTRESMSQGSNCVHRSGRSTRPSAHPIERPHSSGSSWSEPHAVGSLAHSA
jgi:threonine dehydrogenase-like Zn-dependent dehydrogenase